MKLNGDLRIKLPLEYRAKSVEVPIVVIPKRPGHMATADRLLRFHTGCATDIGMVNARSRFQQHSQRSLFFLRRQWWIIVNPKLSEVFIEIKPALANIDAVQSAQQALTNRAYLDAQSRISPLRDNLTTIDNYDTRGWECSEIFPSLFQFGTRPTQVLWVDLFPRRRRKDRARSLRIRGPRRQNA